MGRNKDLRAQKRNLAKVARRARMAVKKLAVERRKTLQKLKKLTVQLKQQCDARESDKRQYISKLDQIKRSRKGWKKRAHAAEQFRRYTLAKRQKMAGLHPAFKTKSKGIYSACLRSLSRRLVMSGVSTSQVPEVMQMCAQAFGIEPGNIPSPRSIGRFVLEGGIAAKIQAGNLLADAQGMHQVLCLRNQLTTSL